MTAHPMTCRARALGAETEVDWLVNQLCDEVDGLHTKLEAALADLADGGAADSCTVLEVLPDPTRIHPGRVAIVSDRELPPVVMGHLRSEREEHTGRWAYPFSKRGTALNAAQRIIDEHPGAYILREAAK